MEVGIGMWGGCRGGKRGQLPEVRRVRIPQRVVDEDKVPEGHHGEGEHHDAIAGLGSAR